MMADVLFVWSKENSDVSYRQGMHELLALVFFVVYHDKIPALKEAQNEEEYTPRSPALLFFLFVQAVAHLLGLLSCRRKIDALMGVVASPDYVEHDTYILFEKIMEVTKTWFESNQRQGEAEVNQGVCCFA